ncbi:MAG TPA: collagen-like protein [Solirubrobacteraceae bacterium]|jgi:hypothetical protein|nr:collagen-like protein [Solirubrobacteraceae bacterium]
MRRHLTPSPATVIATIALILAAGGGAWAASAHHAKAKAHAASSNQGQRGPRGPRGFRGFRGPRGFTGSAGPAGPSDGYVVNVAKSQSLTPGTDDTVATLQVPAGGTYIVTASTELGNQTPNENLLSCSLLQNFNPLDSGSADLPAETVFAATISLTGAASADNGGSIKVTCNPSAGAAARNTVITAVKVGTLHDQTATTP